MGLNPQNIGKTMNHGYAGSYARQPDMIANTHTAGAAIAFSRGGEVYLARIQPLLREAWPEMESWYDEADPYGRRIRVSGDLEPPEGWGGRPASFRRDIYFDGENLLVYKEEPVYTDHVRAGIDAPEAVLEAARQLALADYGEEHMGIKLEATP